MFNNTKLMIITGLLKYQILFYSLKLSMLVDNPMTAGELPIPLAVFANTTDIHDQTILE